MFETDEDLWICFFECLGLSLAIYVKTLKSCEFYFGSYFIVFAAATKGLPEDVGYLTTYYFFYSDTFLTTSYSYL